jgi:hypothetical protein
VDDFGFNNPAFDSFPTFYADQGALDAPIPLDPTTVFPPGLCAGAISGTAITQTGNMGQGATIWPGMGGENIQSGSGGQYASPSAAESTGDKGATNSGRDLQALAIRWADGRTSTPTWKVKTDEQAALLDVAKGSSVPIFVPPNENPQRTVAAWGLAGLARGLGDTANAAMTTDFFIAFRPYGPYDFNHTVNPIYDAYANTVFGGAGQANGVPGWMLQGSGDMLHLLEWGHFNDPINKQAVQLGIDTVRDGGVFIVTPVHWP